MPLALIISPLAVAGQSVLLVVIGMAKLHPLLAAMSAAILLGLLSAVGSPAALHFSKEVERTMAEFGATAGKIAFTIPLASFIDTHPVRTAQVGADATVERPEAELPGIWVSAASVVFPVLLIALAACVGLIEGRVASAISPNPPL
jgi:H+/gluconate symporter-like permease